VPLTREQLVAALRLVDEMVDCDAQLHGNPAAPRRAALEAAIAVRAARLQRYVDAASEVFIAPERRSDRFALDTHTINRALQHDLVLVANVAVDQQLVFGWSSPSAKVGPKFDDRKLAIDWMVEWLADDGEE
jgi:hypothetical protein